MEGANEITEPELDYLSKRWNDVDKRCVTYRHKKQDVSVADKVISVRSQNVSSRKDSSPYPSQFTLDLQSLMDKISHIQSSLRSPELHGNEYEDLSQQDAILKVSFYLKLIVMF